MTDDIYSIQEVTIKHTMPTVFYIYTYKKKFQYIKIQHAHIIQSEVKNKDILVNNNSR